MGQRSIRDDLGDKCVRLKDPRVDRGFPTRREGQSKFDWDTTLESGNGRR